MQSTATRAREHQTVFCGLEVLRLIGERMENRHDVDGEDLDIVLKFMRDVGHRCLENTEEILRAASLDQQVANHHRAKTVFAELTRVSVTEFGSTCRLYTDLVASSISDDRRCVSKLDCDPLTLSQFYEWEREIDELARQYGQTLHQLETKYTTPHCI
jgi:hypothetical protein